MAPPDFGRSVKPISTRRGRLCPLHYYWHPWIFKPSYGPATYLPLNHLPFSSFPRGYIGGTFVRVLFVSFGKYVGQEKCDFILGTSMSDRIRGKKGEKLYHFLHLAIFWSQFTQFFCHKIKVRKRNKSVKKGSSFERAHL